MKKILKNLYELIPLKRQFFSLIRPFGIPEPVFRHLYFKDIFSVKVNSSVFKMIHYGYQIENELFWQGIEKAWEKKSMEIWIELSKNAKVIFDIGANTGIYSLLAKCVNPNSRTYAFEPVERVYKKLKRNSDINGYDIQCIMAAASDSDGAGFIYDTEEEHILSVTVNKNLNEKGRSVQEKEIPLMRLDSFIHEKNIQHIDLMKVDVETHEPEVLKGMGGFLAAFRPVMLVEVLDDRKGAEIENILSGLNYLYYNIDDKTGKMERQDHITKSHHFNFLLCPGEKSGLLKEKDA